MVSGQRKWQEWMPKLERFQSDLRKPCHPKHAGIPAWSGMGAGATRTMFGADEMRGPRFVADFPDLQNHKALGKTRGWESMDHSRACLLFAVKHAAREVPINSRKSFSLTEMNTFLTLVKFFDLHSHRFQTTCCRPRVVFFGGVPSFEEG